MARISDVRIPSGQVPSDWSNPGLDKSTRSRCILDTVYFGYGSLDTVVGFKLGRRKATKRGHPVSCPPSPS